MEKIKCVQSAYDGTYSYVHKLTTKPVCEDFESHIHYGIEIFMFIKGDIEYIVEGNTYLPSTHDILIMSENELHNVRICGDTEYERAVININPEFFELYNIDDYKKIFTQKKPGANNLIKGYIVESEGIYDLFMKIEQYINESNKKSDMIVRSALIEILHILNKTGAQEEHHDKKNPAITKIIAHINKNISQPLTLDDVAQKFYISKYHLCRIFKEYTGMTFNRYITVKRLVRVRSLCDNGLSISEAAAASGFGNYSNFYRAYVSLTGESPKENLKKKK